jgi:two-component sensor histidine kinase
MLRFGTPQVPAVIWRLTADSSRVLTEVWDDVPGAPVAEHADPDDESGRGLMLIEAVCDRRSWATVPGWTGRAGPADPRIR